MVKQNIDLISSANKVLDDVKDNAAVEIAIKQLNALTQQAKQLDKSMEKMKLTSEQAIRITKLNGDAQDTIVDIKYSLWWPSYAPLPPLPRTLPIPCRWSSRIST